MESVAELLVDIVMTLSAGCVVLLQDFRRGALHVTVETVNLQQSLGQRGVLSVVAIPETFAEIREHAQCWGRPMYAVLSTSTAMQSFLTQLSNNETWALTVPKVPRKGTWYPARRPVWIVLNGTPEFLHNVLIPFDCEFLMASSGDDGIVELTEVFHASSTPSFQPLGYWDGVRLHLPISEMYTRRQDLQGLTISALTKTNYPFSSVISDPNGRISIFGFLIDLWNAMEHKMNFTTHHLSNETLSMKQLQQEVAEGRTNCALINVGITLTSLSLVDFSAPLYFSKYQIYIRHREFDGLQWSVLLAPFKGTLWMAYGTAVLTAAACLMFIPSDGDITQHPLLSVLAAFSLQAQGVTPRRPASRLMLLTLYVTALLVATTYSGQLAASLAVRHPALPFTDLDGLSLHPDYKMTVVWQSPEQTFILSKHHSEFIRFNDDVKNIPWETKENASMPINSLEGLKEACHRSVAFLTDQRYMLAYASQLSCRVVALPHFSMGFAPAIPFNKAQPMLGLFTHNLNLMRQTGVLQRQLLKYKTTFTAEEQRGPESVHLRNVATMFILLVIGWIGASILLIAEIFRTRSVGHVSIHSRPSNVSHIRCYKAIINI